MMEKSSPIEKRYDVFISHASEDKEPFVRSLAKELKNKGISVWYDEFTLKLGDSLLKSIDKGLANSRYAVVVLSKSFFGKNWPEKELSGLAARETKGEKVILPIWHEITREEVLQHSPTLAGRLAISTSEEMAKIVAAIINAIKVPTSEATPVKQRLKVEKGDNETSGMKNRVVNWRAIKRTGYLITIIAAFFAILTYLGIKLNIGQFPNGDDTNKQIARIHFEQKPPFVNQAVLRSKQWQVYHFQVQIINESNNSNIRVKNLKLTDFCKLDGDVFKPWENAVPTDLKWPAGLSTEISPGEYVFVPFARIYPVELQKIQDNILSGSVEILQLRFTVARWPRQMTSHISPGTYRFKLTLFLYNKPPTEAEFQLEWSGEHRENLDSMAKDIKIKQIK